MSGQIHSCFPPDKRLPVFESPSANHIESIIYPAVGSPEEKTAVLFGEGFYRQLANLIECHRWISQRPNLDASTVAALQVAGAQREPFRVLPGRISHDGAITGLIVRRHAATGSAAGAGDRSIRYRRAG